MGHLSRTAGPNSVLSLQVSLYCHGNNVFFFLHIQNADTVDSDAGAMSLVTMDVWSRASGILLLHLGYLHRHLPLQIARNQCYGVHTEEQDPCTGLDLGAIFSIIWSGST